MKKIIVGFLAIATLFLTSCGGVSQAEYDKVVAERDALEALLNGEGADTLSTFPPENSKIHVGEKTATEHFEFTFIDCVLKDKIEQDGYFPTEPGPGFIYAVYILEIKNISNEPIQSPILDMKCYADNASCGWDTTGLTFNGYNAIDRLEKINPGRIQSGYIFLEVPEGTKTVEIEYDGIILEHIFSDSVPNDIADTVLTPYKINVGDNFVSNRFNAILLDYYYIAEWSMGLSSYPAKDGYVYIALALSLENTTQNDETINPFSDFVYYADNQLCNSSSLGGLDVREFSKIDDNEAIKPGRILKGYVAAEIPENTEILEVEFDGIIFELNLSKTT